MNLIKEDVIVPEIFYLYSTRRVVIPDTFITDVLGISLKKVNNWIANLNGKGHLQYLVLLDGDNLDTFVNEYYHRSVGARESISMITSGGVRNLLNYIAKKNKKEEKEIIFLQIEEFSKAFTRVQNQKIKTNVFFDSNIKDDVYISVNTMNNVRVNNSRGVNISEGKDASNHIDMRENLEKDTNSKNPLINVMSWIVCVSCFVCLTFLVWKKCQSIGDFDLILASIGWREICLLFGSFISLIVGLKK